MPEFYETAAGRRFYESTMPKIAEELAKLNESIRELIQTIKEANPAKAESESDSQPA